MHVNLMLNLSVILKYLPNIAVDYYIKIYEKTLINFSSNFIF